MNILIEDLKEHLYIYKGKVIKVIDGDTVDVVLDQGFKSTRTERLRLNSVDTPEKSELNYAEAKQFTTDKVLNKEVLIQTYKSDVFGRYLANVWYEEDGETKLLNYELFRARLLKPESKWNTFKEEN